MAQENNSNSNDPKKILTVPVLILVFGVFLSATLIVNCMIPAIRDLSEAKSGYSDALKDYSEKEQQLKTLKEADAAMTTAATSTEGIDKELFKPLESGVDSESIIAAEFNEILALMTSNQIKTRSVKYDYAPKDDNFYKSGSDKFSVCKLDMEMIANYTNFKNFMKELYKHDHYLDIAKVEIIPYKKNKNILLINFQLKLYAQRT